MIVYTSISRYDNCTVFCESTVSGMEGNFAVVSAKMLQAFRSSDSLRDGARRTLVHRCSTELGGIHIPLCTTGLVWGTDSWFTSDTTDDPSLAQVDVYFHILKEDGIVFVCLTNEAGKPSTNYGFLEAVRKEFTLKFSPSRLEKARAYELEKSFSPVLSDFVHYYNTNPNAGSTDAKVIALTAHVVDLKSVIGDNIQLMLKRGDCIESLASQANELESQARVFKKQTTVAKQTIKRKYHKMQFIQCVLISGMAALVVMIVWAIVSRVRGISSIRSSSSSRS